MANLNLAQVQVFESEKEYTKEELYHKLHDLCDCDFNGDNGDDYYTMSKEMSDLEYCIEDAIYKEMSLQDLIQSTVDANYKHETYYNDYAVNFIEYKNLLIVSVATVS